MKTSKVEPAPIPIVTTSLDPPQPTDPRIAKRLFGSVSVQPYGDAISAYIVEQAKSNSDIASFHAHRLTMEIVDSRERRIAIVDRFLREKKGTDDLATDDALPKLIQEFEAIAPNIAKDAWNEDHPIHREKLDGCKITGTKHLPDGSVEVQLVADDIFPTSEVDPVEIDGMLRQDAKLANAIETIDSVALGIPERIRIASRKRWAAYQSNTSNDSTSFVADIEGTPSPEFVPFDHAKLWILWLTIDDLYYPKWVRALLEAIWAFIVRPTIERARNKPPALVMAVHEPVAHLFSPVRLAEERNGQLALPLPGDRIIRIAKEAASIGAESLDALMVNRGVKLFGSVTAHRVLRSLIYTGHRQALEMVSDPRIIRFEGGWAEYAHHVLEMKSKKAGIQAREIIEAMHATEIPLPGNIWTRLLIRTYYPAVGRKKGKLEFVLGTALLPDYVGELRDMMGNTIEARQAIRLVPVLDLPPFYGRERDHGAQATFSMLVIAHIRNNAVDLIRHGGVELSSGTLERLAVHAGLPISTIGSLLDRWTRDGDDGAAMFKIVDTKANRYTLADHYAWARSLIEDGGRREIEGSRAGVRSATKRRNRLARRGK